MRSQGRTEQRALLALDGAEDMQGGYVQLTRSTQRTDLYLTVGPEPLGPDEERPHPAREARAPEELLARVLTRDGSKSLATDTPDVADVRRLSTRAAARRTRPARRAAGVPVRRTARGSCAWPPSARPRPSRPASRPAPTTRPPASRWRRWRAAGGAAASVPAARERLVLAEHALQTTTGQADQAAERLGVLRRAQQRHLGWMEAHDADLRVQERAVAAGGCLAAAGRPARAGPGPAGLAGGRTRPGPERPPGARRCGAWPLRSWTAIGAPTAWTTRRRRSMLGAGWPGTGGRLQRPRPPPPSGPAGPASGGSAAAVASTPIAEATSAGRRRWRPTSGTRSTRTGCWTANPAATPPAAGATGRSPGPPWSSWPAGAATATTATTSLPTRDRPGRTVGRDLGRQERDSR